MNCSPTLTAEEFKNLHNGLCEIRGSIPQLEEILAPALVERLKHGMAACELALKNAYAQDDAAFKKNSDHYDEISLANGFKTIWSMHEVPDLNANHPFADITHLTYEDHWGPDDVTVPVNGKTWLDLWRAAEDAIKQSTDNHHIFIEGITPGMAKKGVLVLSTGS